MNSILRSIVSVVLVVIALSYLITGSAFPGLGGNNNIKSFNQAIDYANEATKIMNNAGYGLLSDTQASEIIRHQEKSFVSARKVDVAELNSVYPGFGDHFRDEFLTGTELLLRGLKNQDAALTMRGQVLLENWADWYGANGPYIRKQ